MGRSERSADGAFATRAAVLIAAALVLVGGIWWWTRDGEEMLTTAPASTGAPVTTAAPATTIRPPTTLPTAAPVTTTPPPPTTAPVTTAPPTRPPVDVPAALTGWNVEVSRIPYRCDESRRCTQVAIDPAGIPVRYDPIDRRVSRERRESESVEFTLPEEFGDASLLHAGPDGVVYFELPVASGDPSEVVAMTLAPGDTGRIVQRFPDAIPPGDVDVLPAPTGLALSGWFDAGPRPPIDTEPIIPWVGRDGGAPAPVLAGSFDDAGDTVSASGWQWGIGGRTVRPEQPGLSVVVPTFDGGFVALYAETTGDLRTEIIRGWRDGTVEYRELPFSWADLGSLPVLEPRGTVLVPSGDWFFRIAPFEERPTGWTGSLEYDLDAGTVTAAGLDEYLDTIVWPAEGQSHVWPWGTSPVAFANAVAGPLSSAAELRTIEVGAVEGEAVVVTVTDEGFLDDSGYGARLTMTITVDQPGFRIGRIEYAFTCQENRGQQDYGTELCT